MAGQRGAADGLARGGARHRGRVEQPEPVAERRREPREQRDRLHQLRRERPQPFVEARLARDVGEQVTEPLLREAQEAALVRAIEQHLRDRQADQLAVGDPRRAPEPPSGRQEIINQHVKARQQGVEVGGHNGLLWSTVIDTADFGASAAGPYDLGINHLVVLR